MKKYTLYFCWLLSCLFTLASLYMSEIRHLEPCALCWYQRIALFPLSLILAVATYRGFFGIAIYVLPLSLAGFFVALYQTLLQEFPTVLKSLCSFGHSCAEKVAVGPFSLALLSLMAFALLNSMLLLIHRYRNISIANNQ